MIFTFTWIGSGYLQQFPKKAEIVSIGNVSSLSPWQLNYSWTNIPRVDLYDNWNISFDHFAE